MTDTSQTSSTEKTSYISDAILLLMGLLVLNQVLLDKFNYIRKDSKVRKYINPPMITTTIGILAGIATKFISVEGAMISIRKGFTQLFLIVLLPPILFESAINMETQPFFKHFGTINLYAIFGTLVAIMITTFLIWFAGLIGMATAFPLVVSFAYGSLISATDPVSIIGVLKTMEIERMLNTLIFGESILNDAISLTSFDSAVLQYESDEKSFLAIVLNFLLVFILSIIIGFIIGIVSAYILKKKNQDSQENVEQLENSILFIVPWVCYLVAESLNLSGIVSIIFCGISMARYAIPNLSQTGKKTLQSIYSSVSHTFENLIFITIGIGFMGFDLAWSQMGAGLFITTFISILLARAINILTMSFIANKFRNRNKILRPYQIILWFSGFRGAMAYALSLESCNIFPQYGNIMLTMTILIAIFNIYISGAFIVTVIEYLKIKQQPNLDDDENQMSDGILARLKSRISQIDEKFLQVTLTNKINKEEQMLAPEIQMQQQQFQQEQQQEQEQQSEQKTQIN